MNEQSRRRPVYDELMARDDAPVGSSWGAFPLNPGRGTANLAGPDELLAAVPAVQDGLVLGLDFALDAFDPQPSRGRALPVHEVLNPKTNQFDDVVRLYPQASSQVDGLRHRGLDGGLLYDGIPVARDTAGGAEGPGGAAATLGIHVLADLPIATRGVLIDIAGSRRTTGSPIDHAAGEPLSLSLLLGVIEEQGTDLRRGDVVMIHTGWAEWYLGLSAEQRAKVVRAGRYTGLEQSRELLRWVWDTGIAVLATDSFAVEVMPPVAGTPFAATSPDDRGMMHQELIAKLGVILGELWRLDELARECRRTARWESLIVVKPLALTGGVGSPANATALR